jgi:hypothetical protein
VPRCGGQWWSQCGPRIGPIELLQLSLQLQGRTFGAPGLTAPAVSSETDARNRGESGAGRVTRRRRLRFTRGSAVVGRQLRSRPSDDGPTDAAAAALGSPVTGRLRSPPYLPGTEHASSRPAVTFTPGAPVRRLDVTATAPERHALSEPVPPASTVLRIPLRGTRLRRAVDPGASTGPAGLTARARPEARPETRVANLRTQGSQLSRGQRQSRLSSNRCHCQNMSGTCALQ